MQLSPYTPGETARELPGRERQMTEIAGLLARVALEGRLAGRVRVDIAQEYVDIDLSELYRTRWTKATERERDLLAAMASFQEPLVARGDIAAQLGIETSALSMARQSLMDKGIVDAPEHGMLAFTAPGFGNYVRSVTRG